MIIISWTRFIYNFENLEYIFRSFKVNNVDKGCELGKQRSGVVIQGKTTGLVPHWVQRILLNQQRSHHLKVGPAPFQLFFVFFHNFLKLVMSGVFFKLTPPLPIFRVVVMCLMLKCWIAKEQILCMESNNLFSQSKSASHNLICQSKSMIQNHIWTRQWFAGVINNQVFLRHFCL